MKKQGLAGSILSYATPCKGKLIISVICALLSVAGGIIPYVAAYRIACFLTKPPRRRRSFTGPLLARSVFSARFCFMPSPLRFPTFLHIPFWS